MRTEPERLVNTEHSNFDPNEVLSALMFGEKPGVGMERLVGIGTIEVALWDAMAKNEKTLSSGYRMVRRKWH